MVWPDRDEKLGETCAKHGIKGIWSCRQCGGSGDTIAYLMQIGGMDFKAALAELGIEGGRASHRRRPAPAEPRRVSEAFTPKTFSTPSSEWQAYAAKLVDEAATTMENQPKALEWLAARGIPAEAVKKYRIGYLQAEGAKYPGRWRARAALGLPPKTDDNGRAHDKIFIPRGIVIPTFAPDGTILNLRIRRHKADLMKPMTNGKLPPKYMELEGSCTAPMLLKAKGPADLAAYCVTEAELDAMLIHFATGGVVGGLAVRTNRGKPDAQAHEYLRQAVKVCIALDYDEPGAVGAPWWEQSYPQAIRWPTPEGKDPGDAFRLGVDIREWVAAALPDTVKLSTDSRETSITHMQASSENNLQNGQMDAFSAGQNELGARGQKGTAPKKKEKVNEMRTRANEAQTQGASALYQPLDVDYPGYDPNEPGRSCFECGLKLLGNISADPERDCARIEELVRQYPIRPYRREGGGSGFAYPHDYDWYSRHSELTKEFSELWFTAAGDLYLSRYWQKMLVVPREKFNRPRYVDARTGTIRFR
jgi:hypothetical protein